MNTEHRQTGRTTRMLQSVIDEYLKGTRNIAVIGHVYEYAATQLKRQLFTMMDEQGVEFTPKDFTFLGARSFPERARGWLCSPFVDHYVWEFYPYYSRVARDLDRALYWNDRIQGHLT